MTDIRSSEKLAHRVQGVLKDHISVHSKRGWSLDPQKEWYDLLKSGSPVPQDQYLPPLIAVLVNSRHYGVDLTPLERMTGWPAGLHGWAWVTQLSVDISRGCEEAVADMGALTLLSGIPDGYVPQDVRNFILGPIPPKTKILAVDIEVVPEQELRDWLHKRKDILLRAQCGHYIRPNGVLEFWKDPRSVLDEIVEIAKSQARLTPPN